MYMCAYIHTYIHTYIYMEMYIHVTHQLHLQVVHGLNDLVDHLCALGYSSPEGTYEGTYEGTRKGTQGC